MSKKAKNIAIMLLLVLSFGIISALPAELSKCSTTSNAVCGDSYGPGNVYMGKKCWSESGSTCRESS